MKPQTHSLVPRRMPSAADLESLDARAERWTKSLHVSALREQLRAAGYFEPDTPLVTRYCPGDGCVVADIAPSLTRADFLRVRVGRLLDRAKRGNLRPVATAEEVQALQLVFAALRLDRHKQPSRIREGLPGGSPRARQRR